jgi:CheY-like chemotaxis protein
MFAASEEGEIDVVLMDMQMPVMDGCEATVQIRRLDREDAGTVLIYACTANNFGEDRERAEQCGMNDFLAKPVDMDKLLQKIEETCGWE